jgi:hypothetical protein
VHEGGNGFSYLLRDRDLHRDTLTGMEGKQSRCDENERAVWRNDPFGLNGFDRF